MSATIRIGQTLRGRLDSYTITHQLQQSIWKATKRLGGHVIVKAVDHFRLQNEHDVLIRFQARTPHIRPLLEEVELNPASHVLVLRYLDDDLLHASNTKRLARSEIKFVARSVLEALQVLHTDGYVHTDIKPSNVLVNYAGATQLIAEVQLSDFGTTVSEESPYAKNGDPIGTPIFRSPEAHLQMRWSTATDIWSFGTMLISLLYGGGFHIFKPDVSVDHEEYDLKILTKQHQCFGPFPVSFEQIADQERLGVLTWVMQNTSQQSLRPFHLTTSREIAEADKLFLLRIMKLDFRDRPTATELLEDGWFREIESL